MQADETAHHDEVSEIQPLLPRNARPSPSSRLKQHFHQELDPCRGDMVLLFCYVITGILDSSAVFIWDSFVSMQTGNTVYLGLGMAQVDTSMRWAKSGLSIGCFSLGSACFGLFYRYFHPRHRWVLCVSFAVQMVLTITAATMVTFHPPQKDVEMEWKALLPACLIAFQSSGQLVTSRALEFRGLTSLVLTTVYSDLFSHPQLFTRRAFSSVEQKRRVGAIVCLLAGTFIGGTWSHSSFGLKGAVWTAAAAKGIIVLTWMVWNRPDPDVEGEHRPLIGNE